MVTGLPVERDQHLGRPHYRIAMLASPSVAIPPRGWDAVGTAVSRVADGLIRRGHDVTVFAGAGPLHRTESGGRVQSVGYQRSNYPLQQWVSDTDHVVRVFRTIEESAAQGRPFDLVHDHCDFTAVALARWLSIPLVHTLHGLITAQMAALYASYSDCVRLVATSDVQLASFPTDLHSVSVIADPIDVRAWPFQPNKENYLLWVGGFDDLQAAEHAAAAARAAHVPLVINAPVIRGRERYFASHIVPHLKDDHIRFVGETSGRAQQRQLISGAKALLVPAQPGSERNRQLILCSLASGTPVIAFQGSGVDDILQDGVNGYLIGDETGLTAAISGVPALSSASCRASVEARFDVETVAVQYERLYRLVISEMAALPM
jgi:glycosyltransferase involved in cell wall biosynthesis